MGRWRRRWLDGGTWWIGDWGDRGDVEVGIWVSWLPLQSYVVYLEGHSHGWEGAALASNHERARNSHYQFNWPQSNSIVREGRQLGRKRDPDRPRNDKGTILGVAIQMLKAEYSSLSEEEHELTQEKNELRDEKASWTGMEPSVFLGPPPAYPFPVPVPIPSGVVPMHPQLQAYPFFQNQTPRTILNSCTPYMAYNRPCHPPTDQPSNKFSTPVPRSSSNQSHSPTQDCRSESSTLQQASCGGRSDDFGDVATDLQLKTPGSSAHSHSKIANKDSSSVLRQKNQCMKPINYGTLTEGSSSSRCSSGGPPNVSNGVGDGSTADDQ